MELVEVLREFLKSWGTKENLKGLLSKGHD